MLAAYILSINISYKHDIVKIDLISLHPFKGNSFPVGVRAMGSGWFAFMVTHLPWQFTTMVVLENSAQNERYASAIFDIEDNERIKKRVLKIAYI
jgi:hypothetical protein